MTDDTRSRFGIYSKVRHCMLNGLVSYSVLTYYARASYLRAFIYTTFI